MEDSNVIFDSLVIQGGGMYGFYHLGALSYLQENGYLNNIKNFSGSSIGAIICYLIIIGCSPIEILLTLHTNQITQKLKDSFNLKNILENKGIFDFSILRNALNDVTRQKLGKEITMIDIKKMFKKNFSICTFNYTKKEIEYITHETNPDMNCIDALQCSASIPLIFDWYDYDGYIYVDGGFVDNFPIDHSYIVGNILGLTIMHTCNDNEKSDAINLPDIFTFMYEMFNFPRYQKVKRQIDKNNLYNIKIENEKKFTGFSFGLSPNTTLEMFSTGYNCSRNFFKNLKNNI